MSGGANRRFCSDPVKFIRQHVLLPSSLDSKISVGAVAGVVQVNIEPRESLYIVSPVSNSPSPKSHNFPAYFLKFIGSGETRTTIGNGADYFFTDSLSGCTVSCGRGPNPLVIHYNWKDSVNSKIDQPRIDADIITSFGTSPHSEIRKADYHSPLKTGFEDGATVVGVRDKKVGNWSFYYQIFDVNDKVLKVQQL